MSSTAYGTIRKLVSDKGFGFIEPDDATQGQFFLHVSGCLSSFKAMQVGDRVSFTPTRGAKGPRAEDVSLI